MVYDVYKAYTLPKHDREATVEHAVSVHANDDDSCEEMASRHFRNEIGTAVRCRNPRHICTEVYEFCYWCGVDSQPHPPPLPWWTNALRVLISVGEVCLHPGQ